jgi:hypothetical protein
MFPRLALHVSEYFIPGYTHSPLNNMKIGSLLTLLALFLVACVSLPGRYYHIELKNLGDVRIIDVQISSKHGFGDHFSFVVPHSSRVDMGPQRHPYADIWTISWRRPNGAAFQKELDLRKGLEVPDRGTLSFQIDENNELTCVAEEMYRLPPRENR